MSWKYRRALSGLPAASASFASVSFDGYIAAPDFAGAQQRLPPGLQLALVQIDGGGQKFANRLGWFGIFQPFSRRKRPGIVFCLQKGGKQRNFRQRRRGIHRGDSLQILDRGPGIARGDLRDAKLRPQFSVVGSMFQGQA